MQWFFDAIMPFDYYHYFWKKKSDIFELSISNFLPLAPSNCQRHVWTDPILWVWSCSKRLHKSKVIIHKSTTQLNEFLSLLKVHYQISKNFLNILFSLIWCNFLVLTLKVSKSQKQTMAPWILPKKERWGNFRFLEESRTPFFFEIYSPLECLKKNFCPWKHEKPDLKSCS